MPTAGSGLFASACEAAVREASRHRMLGRVRRHLGVQLAAAVGGAGDFSQSWLSLFLRGATEARTLGVGSRHACDGAARAGAPSFASMQQPIALLFSPSALSCNSCMPPASARFFRLLPSMFWQSVS